MSKYLSYLILTVFVFSLTGILNPADADEAKEILVDEICESNMDEPMGGDDLYKDKLVKTSMKADLIRKVPSLCADETFTVEFVNKRENIVECFCTSNDQKGILDTPKGSTVNIEGTFKSISASYFESESKQCKITIQDCTFN